MFNVSMQSGNIRGVMGIEDLCEAGEYFLFAYKIRLAEVGSAGWFIGFELTLSTCSVIFLRRRGGEDKFWAMLKGSVGLIELMMELFRFCSREGMNVLK